MLRLQERELEQFLRRCAGQLPVLLRCQGGHPVAGLTGDGDAYATWGNDLSHFLQ